MNEDSWTDTVIGAVILILAPLGYIVTGWATRILWAWFVVPVTGLPAVTTREAIGIALIVGLLTYRYTPTPKQDMHERRVVAVGRALSWIVTPLIMLGIGWIVH